MNPKLIQYPRWTEEEIILLRNVYSGLYLKDLIKFFPNRTMNAIVTKASQLKLKSDFYRKGVPRKYTVDHNYWSVFTNENCYWGGFMAADGCVSKSKNNIQYKFYWSCSV